MGALRLGANSANALLSALGGGGWIPRFSVCSALEPRRSGGQGCRYGLRHIDAPTCSTFGIGAKNAVRVRGPPRFGIYSMMLPRGARGLPGRWDITERALSSAGALLGDLPGSEPTKVL